MPGELLALTAVARAGFRRFATYRAATAAGAFTNTVFGLVRASILASAVTGAAAPIDGYTAADVMTFAWLGQALIAPIYMFQWNELALRIRTGDIAVDLARPLDLQARWLAEDLGRALYSALARAPAPLLVGALTVGLAMPSALAPYLLGATSLVLAVIISFGCRFLVSLTAFWLVEVRGVIGTYVAVSNVLCGLLVPVAWFPPWLDLLARATPFPSMLQAPIDVLTGRSAGTQALGVLAVQGLWVAVLLLAGRLVLRRATRKLVVQGG